MNGRLFGVVLALLLAPMPGAARASDDFSAALSTACEEATALEDAGLLDMAYASYSSLRRTAPGYRCDEDRVGEHLAALRATERHRARAIERARLYRLAAAQADGLVASRWARRAYDAYVAGLRLDPVGDGARAGLRQLLAQQRVDADGAHCARARQLLDVRLLWEARAELARGMTAREPECDQVRADLVDARAVAYDLVHRGLAAERAGDPAGARGSYIEALAADPGAFGARAGLRRTRPPLPTEAAQPQVLAHLQIGAGCEDGSATSASGPRPPVVSRVTIRMPAGDPDIRIMRDDRERDRRFHKAAARLLRRAGLPPPRKPPPSSNAQDRAGTVELTIRDGVAELALEVSGVVYGREPQFLWPWIIESADAGLVARPALRRSPPGTKKRAEVVSCVWKPVDASPLPPSDSAPTSGDRSSLGWELVARSGDRPEVVLEAPLLDRWSLASSSLASPLRFLGSILVPVVLLWLTLRCLPKTERRPRWAARLTVLLYLTLTGCIAVLVGYPELIPPGWETAVMVVPVLILLGLGAVIAPPATALARLVIGAASVAGLTIVLWSSLRSIPLGPDLPDGVVLALALVLVALLTLTLLASALHAMAFGLGSPLSGWPRVAAYTVILVVVAAQAAQFVLQRRTGWWSRSAVFEGDIPIDDGWLHFVDSSTRFAPFNILSAGAPLLLVVTAGLALAALRLGHSGQPAAVTFSKTRLRRLVTVLFVAVAVGTSAPLLGFPVPVAFALSLLYLRWIRSGKVEAAEEYTREQLGRDPEDASALSADRDELLARAAAAHRQLRVEDDLHAKYGAGEGDANDVALRDGLTAAQECLDKLRSGRPTDPTGKPPITVPLPDGAPPEDVALALGPTGDWWANGRRAVVLAWPLLLIPVLFSTYVLVEGIVDRWSWAMLFQSPVGVVANVARETVFWTVSAFSLGALLAYLPFRNAPMKGLALAGAYIAPLLALQVIGIVADSVFEIGRPFQLELSDWSFRGFELILFLMAVGVRLDALSVKDSVARLVPLYGLDDFRSAIVYIAPVVLTIVLVGGQLFRGDASSAVQTILESASSFVPGGPVVQGLTR